MNLQKKKVLFILPELTNPGGMELENLGFIAAVKEQEYLDVSVLNFYRNPVFFNKPGFVPIRFPVFEIVKVFFSIRFLKIFFKSGLKMNQSLANLAQNFPEVLKGFFKKALDSSALCFAGIRPGKLLHLFHDLSKESQKPFVYHEISKFNPKHHSFFQKVNSYGTFLISGIEKKEDLLLLFPQARFLEINQWLYDGQETFLKIPDPNPAQIVFGTLTRLDFGKNLEVVFEAMAILKEKEERLKYLLFGDGPELQKLKQLAAKLEIESLIDFRGAIKFEERNSVYSELDVFLMSSVIEGGPVTILEAMASGRPVITTNVGDVRNRIENEVNGYILDSPTDPVELTEKISIYLDQPQLVILHGKNSRSKFMKEFNEGISKETFINAISKLILN